jgi:hypothetical protein|tara:strand:- start:6341 stop:6715 length:375 start_codon:yes stop_codon:yes gene_type:complete
MPRTTRQKIEVNNTDSLQSVLQEVYNNVCTQIKDAQKIVNEVGAAQNIEDTDDLVKIAKAKTDALKLKDSAIKTKLDIGKLQSDILKHSGDVAAAITNNPEIVGKDAFANIRELIKAEKKQELN